MIQSIIAIVDGWLNLSSFPFGSETLTLVAVFLCGLLIYSVFRFIFWLLDRF